MQTWTLLSGSSKACGNIPVVDDSVVESDDDFTVTLCSMESVLNGTATVIIRDNDGEEMCV